MNARIAAFDWSTTPLGRQADWSASLRAVVELVLGSPLPAILLWGPELTQIYNDGYARILGSKHPRALGMPTHECWPELAAFVAPIHERVLGRGESVQIENQKLLLYRDGEPETGYFTLCYSPARDDEGAVKGIFLTLLETTAALQAEEVRRRSETRFRNIADHSPLMMWITDADGNATYLNRLWYEFTGQTREEALGVGWLDAVHPDDRERSGAIFLAAIESRAPCRLEYRLRRRDGVYRWCLDDATPWFLEGDVFHGYLGSVIDITDRKQAEDQVQASESQFRQLADAMPQMVFAAQPDGHVDYFNKQWYDYTGLPEGSVGFENWKHVHTPDGLARAMEVWPESLRTGKPYEIEYPLRRHDGEYRWHLGRAVAVRDERGNIIRWYGTNTDVHDQRLAREELSRAKEAAERASAAKSEFLATLSHELRTPLTPVLLTASLIEARTDLPDDLREDIATIRRNVELESRLISDLLDLTRISNNKLQLDRRLVDLHLLIRSAIDICQRDRSARVDVEFGALLHTADGDSTRLQQILWNLISNAIKFTPDDGLIVVRTSNPTSDRIRIDVIDTGEGIDAAVLPKLFTAFEQGETRASKQFAGLGLGLAISKRLAEAHGGTITAFSAGRGHGTTMTVDLPVVSVGAAQQIVAQPAPMTAQSQALRVLLVEDHEPTRAVLTKLLRLLGHTVTATASVASAVAAATEGAFDLLISDLGLPDGSGLNIMQSLRPRFAGRAIALTGYGMEDDIIATREAGFVHHLTKPVDAHSLAAAIERVLEG